MLFKQVDGTQVLVGHESESLRELIGLTLLSAGFSPVCVTRGDQVMGLLRETAVPVVVLDVALENVPAFEVINQVRGSTDLFRTKVVLVTSVFNRIAYKRQPQNLHGADDFVEQHLI